MQDYSLGDVARILKVSPRRLRYWQQTQLVESPTASEDEQGDAGYAFRDLVCLRSIVSLLDKGISLQSIRRNLETLRDRDLGFEDPATALQLWDERSDRLVVRREGRLEETGGQLLLDFASDAETETRPVADFVRAQSALQGSGVASFPPDREFDALSFFERGCELDAEPSGWSEAVEAYEAAIELDPGYADAYCNLGAVRYNQGKREEARHAFERCLRLAADHVEANFNLANVLEESGEDDLALIHYRRALAADPHYPDLHINLALLYEKLSRNRAARGHWRRYLQLDPAGSWADVARLRMSRDRSADPDAPTASSEPSTSP